MQADADRDGRVNLTDFNIVAANFGQSNRTFSQGDFNYDRMVSLDDFNILAARFGQVLGPGTEAASSGSIFGDAQIDSTAEANDALRELLS